MFKQVRNSLSLSQKQPPQLVFDPPSAFRDMNGSTMTAMEFQTEAQKPEVQMRKVQAWSRGYQDVNNIYCNLTRKMSREKPVFSTRAHVFQIDPETKKSWLPCSRQAIPVMFYYDPNKETHRIISVDGSKAVINSTILPNMTFTKTSQKFGQWSDGRANTVFGLGFSSEAELNKFAEKFKEVKGSTRTASNSSSVTSNSSTGGNTNGGAMNGMSDSPISTPNVGHQSTSLKSGSSGSSGEDEMKDATGISHKPIGNTESQLKYENDRLKMALAQSSSNAKKWETELQTLKNNNARLTAALQESTTNVEEWKKQLNAYKEDNIRLRKKVQELETSEQVSEKFNSLQQEKLTLDGRVIQLDSMLRQRDEDIATLRQSNADLSNQNQILQIESEKLESKTRELTAQLSESSLNESRLKDLSELQKTLADKIQELTSLNTQLAASLQPRPPAPENS